MIPKKIHYVFGMDEKFCKKPLSYFHYLNILSAKLHNKGYDITLYYFYEPVGPIWEKIKNTINCVPLTFILSKTLNGREFSYKEHIGDYTRLEILRNSGGIYLDIDVVCLKSFDDILDNECVMGIEQGEGIEIGLCNAVILSKKDSVFVNKWLLEYDTNYTTGWNEMSVQLPRKLSISYPEHITIQDKNSFFPYSWDKSGRHDIFINSKIPTESYCIHLWESKNFDLLKQYDSGYLSNRKDTLSLIYKNTEFLSN